jgi:uncharacterized protein (DUF2147 family)
MRVLLASLVIVVAPNLYLQAGPAHAAEPTAVGLWEQIDDSTGKANGWFLITERNGVYDAVLVKLFVKPGANPNPLCTKCPSDQKGEPWLGLTIVKGMERNGLDYEHGTVFDPRTGSKYLGRMRLGADGRTLTVRGYLGIDPLGGDETWRRLPAAALEELAPAITAAGASASSAIQRNTTSPKVSDPASH